MQAANEQLEQERAEGKLVHRNIEDIGEDQEGYIEMDLGLGVLEEKKAHEGVCIEDEAPGIDEEGDEEDSQGERDVLGRLLGKRREKPGIEVL